MKRGLFGTVAVLVGIFSIGDRTLAQVVPDNTLGTTVNLNGTAFEINNGMRSGNNLFHSFSQFSIPTGGSAIFNNALDVQNIFSRVTGSQLSNIDGILKTQGTANLFLMNPNGIIFGPNAQLQLGGSFLGTTANSIQFADGIEFNSLNTTPALLSVNVPIGLQMGTNSGAITVQNTGHQLSGGTFVPFDTSQNPIGLQAGFGQTLAFVGGTVNLAGGILSINGIGHLEVSSIRQGQVNLNPTQSGWVGDYSSVSQFGDIHLANQSLLDASGYNSSIALQGRNISLTNGSFILKNNFGSQPTGGILINATDAIHLTGNTANGALGSAINSTNLGLGTVAGISITANQLLTQDGGRVEAWTFTPAGGGNINIDVRDRLEVHGFNGVNPGNVSAIGSVTFGMGQAGEVQVTAKDLQLLNGGSVFSATASTGQAGQVRVDVADLIEIADAVPATVSSSSIVSSSIGSGNASNVVINTSRLLVRDSGVIGSTALASGSTGSITVNASESIEVRGVASGLKLPSRLLAAVEIVDPRTQAYLRIPAIPTGNAGTLSINTPSLQITDRATVTVRNDGAGRAGDLKINAPSFLLDDRASVTASTASGSGGNININSNTSLLMRHGSLISGSTRGAGDGGNVTIHAPIILGLENSDIIANTVKGHGGNINITTQGIFGLKFRNRLTPDNDITASSEFGVNGNVQVNTIGINPANALNALPTEIVDSSRQIADRCGVAKSSSFIATGRGGIPQGPMKKTQSDRVWHDMRAQITSSSVTPVALSNPIEPLIETSAIQVDQSGSITLVAPHPIGLPAVATCAMK